MGIKQNTMSKIRKALISVSNKKDLKPFLNNFELYLAYEILFLK